MALTIDIAQSDPGTYHVTLGGSLDADTSEQLDQMMDAIWADPASRVIRLELHDLKYISSMGLGSLAKIKKATASRGGAMVVVGAQPQIERVFAVVKMLPRESLFLNNQQADAYLSEIQQRVLDRMKENGTAQ